MQEGVRLVIMIPTPVAAAEEGSRQVSPGDAQGEPGRGSRGVPETETHWGTWGSWGGAAGEPGDAQGELVRGSKGVPEMHRGSRGGRQGPTGPWGQNVLG